MTKKSLHYCLSIGTQYLLPHHLLSVLVALLAKTRVSWLKKAFISWFIARYRVNMQEAVVTDIDQYANFQQFFTRLLKPELRPIVQTKNVIASPVDGSISQLGDIREGRLIQAKNHVYSVQTLLGDDKALAERFSQGKFITLYLAPKDYHRVHMPLAGILQKMIYVPGRVFSVNPLTVENVPNLFARNERVVTIFDTDAGLMAVILVGAMIVRSISTVWAGVVTPPHRKAIVTWDYSQEDSRIMTLHRGEEVGQFNMGSTVMVLFASSTVAWHEAMCPEKTVKYGEPIGRTSL